MPSDCDAMVINSYVPDALDFVQKTSPSHPQSTHKSMLAAIANGRYVKQALAALPDDRKAVETVNCSPIVRILNCVSAAYYDQVYGKVKGPAIIFGTMANSTPRGNYLNLAVKPAYYAYLGTTAELGRIIGGKAIPSPKSWSEFIQVAEHQAPNARSADGQLETVLRAHKAYRPDLATVHSFSVGNGTVQLASLNACGVAVSPPAPWTELNSWLAHVALLYETHRPRDGSYDPREQPDRDIQYCSAQRDFYRWDVRAEDGEGVAVSPFYASQPPGRTTFACFDILPLPKDDPRTDPESLAAMGEAFRTGAVQGFWKMSWQAVSSNPTENELLSELHQNGWVPGLVRPFELKRYQKEAPKTDKPQGKTDVVMTDETLGKTDAIKTDEPVQAKLDARLKEQVDRAIYHPSIKPDCIGDNIGRVKDVLHLGSVGRPLSQCKTAGDLLRVMYDLIEVHDHLCELGVLHRDVSWFNVMCEPQHLIKLHPLLKTEKVLSRPCINQILGEGDPEPCVLLADLDHGIKLDGSATPQPGEKIVCFVVKSRNVAGYSCIPKGTPMFISVEVSQPDSLKYDSLHLGPLRAALFAAETDTDIFKRAFPAGVGTFMSDFELVMKHESERAATAEEGIVPPPACHNARHDAESIYWLFLWAFARARPLDASPLEEKVNTLEQFCGVMFSHSIGGTVGEAGRAPWITNGVQIKGLFHPLLKPFELLFQRMAKYLSVPWFLYCGGGGTGPNGQPILDIMKPNHVHVAFRRLALVFMRDPNNAKALRIALDTQAPRYTSIFDGTPFRHLVSTTKRAMTGARGTVAYPVALHTGTENLTSPKKRKAASTALSARKHKRSEQATMGGGLTSTDDESDIGDDDDIAEDLDSSAPLPQWGESAGDLPVQYVASEHQHSHSAMALRLMFSKDRALWFGAGVDPKLQAQSAA